MFKAFSSCRAAAIVAAALSLTVPSARAQDASPIDDARANARAHVGPFYFTPSLALRDLGVDGNVFNEPDDPKRDFTFTLAPGADAAVPIARRALVRTRASADLVYYQTYSSERSANPRLSVRGDLFFNRFALFVEPSYLRTRQRPNFEIDARSLRTEREVAGGIGYHYSPKLSFEVAARRHVVDFAADETFLDVRLRETLNRESRGVQGSVRYALTPLTTIVLRAESTRDRFEFSPDRDADTFRLMPGVEFKPRALISGRAYVGVRRFETKSDALEDFHGLVAAASLSYTLLGRTTFVLAADRDVTYSFERFQPYFVVDGYGLTVRHRLAGRFDVTVGAQRHRYAYRDLFVTDAPVLPEHRVDVTRNLHGSVGYNFNPGTRLGLGVSYWQRESNSMRFRDYEGLRAGTSLSYGF